MKIIHILPELQIGGVERHVIDLANEQARRGHQVMVVSAGGQMERQLHCEVRVRHLPVHKKNPLTGLYSALRIARWVKREGWQIIHAHSRVPAWIANWAASLSCIPWVYTAHAVYSHNFGLHPLAKAKSVICISRAVMDNLRDYLPADRTVIYNGLPEKLPQWHRPVTPMPVILAVGRLTKLKGIDTLLKALALAKNQGLTRWKLAVVGDGPQKDELERLTDSLGLSAFVEFTGYREDIVERLLQCSCYVLPSTSEGMGLTLMMAVKMGVPVLASDLPALRELAIDGEKLLSPSDPAAWADALRRLLTGHNDTAPRFNAEALLTEPQMAAEVLSVYERLV
ncbi:MAG: glycosyltransferase family 4 protein [Pyramidobacter sp.]|jgi:glycosyltransferase involved in cell wall biosynthesis